MADGTSTKRSRIDQVTNLPKLVRRRLFSRHGVTHANKDIAIVFADARTGLTERESATASTGRQV